MLLPIILIGLISTFLPDENLSLFASSHQDILTDFVLTALSISGWLSPSRTMILLPFGVHFLRALV
jgi:hypothetical protein